LILFLGLIFGAMGTVYLIYGRKEHSPLFLITGFLLLIYPYLFSNAIVIVIVGVVLSLIPVGHHKGWF